ncbi:hypothetical protein SARC_09381 [Sphaeroforma arctica JP610]|uniref:C2H2-type domain-containing protein n=1 Tax=Sphaeroforma arctica JP610 TaxID=667725 RepID=A0A0L0FN64_9EUKA|nr:hypothetical protein SARC_09381 [Sphaeroforma arctica JP610]KNC78174.1 hypothetical protein SARC_09381 [Sphaeroforma arctica JP610]|eukprot:XP_014152076.1 hypothetical protein SARC_09381 [Sphaeroforma arctica JP610]
MVGVFTMLSHSPLLMYRPYQVRAGTCESVFPSWDEMENISLDMTVSDLYRFRMDCVAFLMDGTVDAATAAQLPLNTIGYHPTSTALTVTAPNHDINTSNNTYTHSHVSIQHYMGGTGQPQYNPTANVSSAPHVNNRVQRDVPVSRRRLRVEKTKNSVTTKWVVDLNGVRRHGCTWENCDKSFTAAHSLMVHMRSHTGERPYECQYEGCDRKFYDSGSLTKHNRIHTGVKNHACKWPGCNLRFAQNAHLQRHASSVHEKIKPYPCPWTDCDRMFARKSHIKSHYLKHTGERPYVCSWEGCTRTFQQSGTLKTHMRTHTGEKPYNCEDTDCDKTFTSANGLRQHRIRHHGDAGELEPEEERETEQEAL